MLLRPSVRAVTDGFGPSLFMPQQTHHSLPLANMPAHVWGIKVNVDNENCCFKICVLMLTFTVIERSVVYK